MCVMIFCREKESNEGNGKSNGNGTRKKRLGKTGVHGRQPAVRSPRQMNFRKRGE